MEETQLFTNPCGVEQSRLEDNGDWAKPVRGEVRYAEDAYQGAARLLNRTALVIGGEAGLGRAVAVAFAQEGADVAISCLQDDGKAEETNRLIRGTGQKALTLAGDIGYESHCRWVVNQTLDDFGRLDILVNVSAFQPRSSQVDLLGEAEFDRTMRTNVYALFNLCRVAVPKMARGASIINTAYSQSVLLDPTLWAYAATEGAVVQFTKALARTLAGRGIRANVVAPEGLWTPDSEGVLSSKGVPVSELAALYVFLASGQAGTITGQVFGGGCHQNHS